MKTTNLQLDSIVTIFTTTFDTDIQVYLKNLLTSLSKNDLGKKIRKWADSNPIKFKIIIRLISIGIQQIPDKHLLSKVIKEQLIRLPAEVIGIVKDQNFKEQESIDKNTYILAEAKNMLDAWTEEKKNNKKISLLEYLNESSKAIQDLGSALQEGYQTNKVDKDTFRNIIDDKKRMLELKDKLRKENPDFTDTEIEAMLDTEEITQLKDSLSEFFTMLPELLIKASFEIEIINANIKKKIYGKSNEEALVIFKDHYTDLVRDSINEVIMNDELDLAQKQNKIKHYLIDLGKMYESFNYIE